MKYFYEFFGTKFDKKVNRDVTLPFGLCKSDDMTKVLEMKEKLEEKRPDYRFRYRRIEGF